MPDQRNRIGLTTLTYQILLALAEGPCHGYAILKEIEERGGLEALPSTGALYTALSRLESAQHITEAEPPASETDPRRRYYAITPSGQAVAKSESRRLAAMVAVARERRLLPGPLHTGDR